MVGSRFNLPVLSTCEYLCLNLNQLKFYKLKFQFLVTLATFQVLSSGTRLIAPVFNRADMEHFYHCRKFYQMCHSRPSPPPPKASPLVCISAEHSAPKYISLVSSEK